MLSERIQRRIDRLLDQAEEAIDQGDWDRVSQRSRDVLALDPENGDAVEFLRAAERRKGADEPAVADSDSVPRVSDKTVGEQTLPSSFADGRYQVKRFLGEGGKKMVYLAQDTLLDRDVAFALIKTDGLDDVSRTRISREAQAMGRLGSHPHIVTVFDLGEHEGQPFMVTELMGGGDVEAIIEDAEGGKLPLEQAISIAVETCRGLEFAHSKGIVHRDLKPGNVWLTADGVAKIGDFGLAVATDRSRLTAEGMMVGTVSYMPPEQAMGGEVTPKADLYSLGAMLYEMVCGRPPFLGDDNIAIIGQHINTPPVAPTWHRSDCPRPLEALIMRLLSKKPSERPESASDVLAALESIDTSSSEQSITEPEQAVNVLDSLAGDVFVGRQREMDELKAALEDSLGGRGRMVTLVGEPGIGKTRTAQELVTYARLRGCQVLWGRCYEEQGVPPYWPWVQAIRNYVRERDPEQLNSEMGSGAADIAEIVSDVRDRLPGLPRPPQIDDPDSARFRLFDSITTFLKAASQRQPIVLILDDLHWSDQPSLALLQFIVRELAGARILLIGTYRDVELNRRHPLAEALGDLNRERLFSRVLLRGLTHDDVGRFIEVTSGITPPASLIEAVHTQTEGNPLFVTEIVRLLVQEGELSSDESTVKRESWTVRIPEGVREVIGRRLNQLSARCNDVLAVASVVGREFELRQLVALTDDLTEDMLLDVLEEGLSARVIEELPTSMGLYQFTHALIQETLVEELSLTRRVRLHARIAETLEQLYGDHADDNSAQLAHHFAQAEAMLGSEKLLHYSVVAGKNASRRFAFEEAVTQLERALNIKNDQDDDEDTAAILSDLSRALLFLGNIPEAATHIKRAFAYYVQAGDVTSAAAVVEFPHSVNFLPLLNDELVEAINLSPEGSLQSARLLCSYGLSIGIRASAYDQGREALDKSLDIARRHGDLALERRIMAALANVDGFNTKWQHSLEQSLRSLELAAEPPTDPIDVLRAYLWASQSLFSTGEGRRAEKHATDMLEIAESFHDRSWMDRAFYMRAKISRCTGDWQSVVSNVEKLTTSDSTGDPSVFKSMIACQVGDYEQANDYLNDTLTAGVTRGVFGDAWSLAAAMMSHITNDKKNLVEIETRAVVGLSNNLLPEDGRATLHYELAVVAILGNDPAKAAKSYDSLLPFRNTILTYTPPIDRTLGDLAQIMGKPDDARLHFEEAVAFCRKAEYRPELAWSLHDYADMLLQRDGDSDKAKATSLLDEALRISTDLGMRPLMERVLSRREILKA